jgi:hypothetical protein
MAATASTIVSELINKTNDDTDVKAMSKTSSGLGLPLGA